MTPDHYKTPVSPWDLQEHMHSSGNAFVDARRADVIKYIFSDKTDLLEDLKEAKHCIEAAIRVCAKHKSAQNNTYVDRALNGGILDDPILYQVIDPNSVA